MFILQPTQLPNEVLQLCDSLSLVTALLGSGDGQSRPGGHYTFSNLIILVQSMGNLVELLSYS